MVDIEAPRSHSWFGLLWRRLLTRVLSIASKQAHAHAYAYTIDNGALVNLVPPHVTNTHNASSLRCNRARRFCAPRRARPSRSSSVLLVPMSARCPQTRGQALAGRCEACGSAGFRCVPPLTFPAPDRLRLSKLRDPLGGCNSKPSRLCTFL